MINVTKTFLPPLNEYITYLEKIWESGWITNNGLFVRELEDKLKDYLGVKHLFFVSNGTIALQIAIKALELKGDIITTPYSYVATTSSILWENCNPIFVDIENDFYTINPDEIEKAITPTTRAILATHVYGYPCQIERINEIAKKYDLKVIYDAAHAFGSKYKGNSLLKYGDISTVSFHATKLFHTIEGGAIITNNDEAAERINLMRAFGHQNDEHYILGINGKNSELHAAMGLCNLKNIDMIIRKRRELSCFYRNLLGENNNLTIPEIPNSLEYNSAYFPVVFYSITEREKIKKELEKNGINTRRYFWPSLNKLPYLENTNICVVSEEISGRVLCLPLYHELLEEQITEICSIINRVCETV